jgi:hypothetical protein
MVYALVALEQRCLITPKGVPGVSPVRATSATLIIGTGTLG